MCGIAGVLAPGTDAVEATGKMIAALTHRGPDGVRTEATPQAALAHARLKRAAA